MEEVKIIKNENQKRICNLMYDSDTGIPKLDIRIKKPFHEQIDLAALMRQIPIEVINRIGYGKLY